MDFFPPGKLHVFSSGRRSFLVLSVTGQAGDPHAHTAQFWTLAKVHGAGSGGSKPREPATKNEKLTPATAPGSPAVPCSEYKARTRNERRNKEERTESAKRNGENKGPLERSGK